METEIYSFLLDHSPLLMLLYGVLLLCGAGFVVYALFVMPNKECEFDGRNMKLKRVPIGFRILMQGVPALMGIACIVAGVINGCNSGKYYLGYYRDEVLIAEGIVEDVCVVTREDGIADICFHVEGEEFSLEFSEELAARFTEAEEITVQYGLSGEDKLIYYLHANE